MNPSDFEGWLRTYGEIWESRSWDKVDQLYSAEIDYYWTPFEEPIHGREAISEVSRDATSRQEAITFSYEVLALTENKGLARWWCSFNRVATGRRVKLDGILIAVFDDEGLCREFREWWHSDEPENERPTRSALRKTVESDA